MRTADFHYDLPLELIAQEPSKERGLSRLLIFQRDSQAITHKMFPNLADYLQEGDLLVLNDSRVLPARLQAEKQETLGSVEVLLIEELACNRWKAMLRPAKRVRPGTRLTLRDRAGSRTPIEIEVISKDVDGFVELAFQGVSDLRAHLDKIGDIPLPPYIQRGPEGARPEDFHRYQTVFAARPGSVAAPTAGLHFTREFLDQLTARGIRTARVTLHVGPGTFAPVKASRIEDHAMHEESFELPAETVQEIARARSAGRRVVAIGTTSLRVIESAALAHPEGLVPMHGRTRLFVYPPWKPAVVDALLTNFHLPESTLLMLVSAFASPGRLDGRERILEAYRAAIQERYRFFSYGDAMLIL